MKNNKPWMQEQLITQFKKVMGDMKPVLSEDENEEKDDTIDSNILDSDNFDDQTKKKK